LKSDNYHVNYPGGEFPAGSYRVWKEADGIYYYRGQFGDLALSFDPINVIVADQSRAWKMPRREWSEYFVNKFQPILKKGEVIDPGTIFVGTNSLPFMTFGSSEWGTPKIWGDGECMSSCSAEVTLSGDGCGLELSAGMIYSIGSQTVSVGINDPCGCITVTINGSPPPVAVGDGELIDAEFDYSCEITEIDGPTCQNVIPLNAFMLEEGKIGFSHIFNK
jgi:hypothetical protein